MNALSPIDPHRNEVATASADAWSSMIERVILNPSADLDKLERMLALKLEADRDSARVAFAGALAVARAKIPPIVKDATVDFTSSKGRTHYKHETLAGIAKVIDPILSEHGLSYRFRTDQTGGGVRVTCIIAHSFGHSEETTLACAPDGSGSKNPFQAVGSAVTYLQRYTLKAALGLSAEVDDDAQAAAPRPGRRDDRRDHDPIDDDRPAFDAQGCLSRLLAGIERRKTKQQLTEFWAAERDARMALKDAAPAAYQTFFAAFQAAGSKAHDDAAMQSPPVDDLGVDSIPY